MIINNIGHGVGRWPLGNPERTREAASAATLGSKCQNAKKPAWFMGRILDLSPIYRFRRLYVLRTIRALVKRQTFANSRTRRLNRGVAGNMLLSSPPVFDHCCYCCLRRCLTTKNKNFRPPTDTIANVAEQLSPASETREVRTGGARAFNDIARRCFINPRGKFPI